MKVKLALGIALIVLIAAQIIFGGRAAKPSRPAAEAASASAGSAVPPPPARPAPDDIVAVTLGDGREAVSLARADGGWTVRNLKDHPADADRIDALLHSVLASHADPLPEGLDPAAAGLGDDALHLSFGTADGSEYQLLVGLRPEGEYNRTYVRLPGGRDAVLSGDVRGALGVWRNQPGVAPDAMEWMDRVVLRFNPEDVAAVTAEYPDHTIRFVRGDDHIWHAEGYVPGDDWNLNGLTAWIQDLSRFQVAGLAEAEATQDAAAAPSHVLRVDLAGGGHKELRIHANRTGGEGMLAESDDFPGRAYHLPEWRFRKYFRSLPGLFPLAAPSFALADIRFLDIRRGGETLKITRRDGEWQAVALPYPLRPERVDRLARLLAGWHPEDYATPDFKKSRPSYGGPMVEVILADGNVHQYRLAGRHPLFPWRYVAVNGASVFSVTNPEADVMFPEFAEIMDLGRVFPSFRPETIAAIRLEGADAEAGPLLALRLGDDEVWTAERNGHSMAVDGVAGWRLAIECLNWHVAGFHNGDRDAAPAYRLRLEDRHGAVQTIALLPPEERDVPYFEEGGRTLVVNRSDFLNWLTEADNLMDAVDRDAADAAALAETVELDPEPEIAPEPVSEPTPEPEPEELDINDLGPEFPDDPAPAAEHPETPEESESPEVPEAEPATDPVEAARNLAELDASLGAPPPEADVPAPELIVDPLDIVEEVIRDAGTEAVEPAPEPAAE